MALPKTDTFTGTNGDLLSTYNANWVIKQGSFNISGTQVVSDGSGLPDYAIWTGDSFNNDQYSKCKLISVGAGVTGIMLRSPSSGKGGYYFFGKSDESFLGTIASDGTPSDIGGDRGDFANGDIIELSASGNRITLKKNSGTLTTADDSTFTSGYAGISTYYRGYLDDFEGGNVGAGGATEYKSGINLGINRGINRGIFGGRTT